MKFSSIFNLIFLLYFFMPNFIVAELITATTGAVGAMVLTAGLAGVNYLYCLKNECCNDQWIKLQYEGLKFELQRDLYGQHLAQFLVLKSLWAHVNNSNPKKALVMSFHGWTGSGKNYVAQMIVNSLYSKKENSQYYHLYIGDKDFPHKNEVDQYKDYLRNEVIKHTKKCKQSVFLFDEVDKIPPGVLDALAPFMDFYESLDGVDYRKNIFIFISNSGGNNITNVAMKFWGDGKDREDISQKDLEPVITKGIYNEMGGLHHSEIIKKDLIDVYVPFLPLEKKHVKKCIEFELQKRKWSTTQAKIERIVNQMAYDPPEINLYATSGCKRVSQKVDIYGKDDFV